MKVDKRWHLVTYSKSVIHTVYWKKTTWILWRNIFVELPKGLQTSAFYYMVWKGKYFSRSSYLSGLIFCTGDFSVLHVNEVSTKQVFQFSDVTTMCYLWSEKVLEWFLCSLLLCVLIMYIRKVKYTKEWKINKPWKRERLSLCSIFQSEIYLWVQKTVKTATGCLVESWRKVEFGIV